MNSLIMIVHDDGKLRQSMFCLLSFCKLHEKGKFIGKNLESHASDKIKSFIVLTRAIDLFI